MSTTITAGAWTIEVLAAGDQLKGGGTVAAGQIAVRVDGHEQAHVRADLLPLEELAPIDPDPTATATPTAVTTDVDVPGLGTLKAGATYLTTVANGATVNAYAVVGRELIEAYEFHTDRTPNWSTASICEPGRGEADFYYPAVALLRFLNDQSDLPVWHHNIRTEFDAAFTMYGAQRLIAGWYHDVVSGGYRITVWQPNGTTTQVVLRTPDETAAFIAGVQAATNAQPATR